MKGALFFTCLCLLLLSGSNVAYTGVRYNSTCHAPTKQVQKKQSVKITDTNHDYTVIADNSLNKEAADLISEEAEDDDVNASARKCKWLSKDNLSCSSLFNLSFLHSRLKAAQPFYGNLSGKYITLRVLRI
jgi:hypothetical protein